MSDCIPLSLGRRLCANGHTYEFWLELGSKRIAGTAVWLAPEFDETLTDLSARALARVLHNLQLTLGSVRA